jgi:hypothetical protein
MNLFGLIATVKRISAVTIADAKIDEKIIFVVLGLGNCKTAGLGSSIVNDCTVE